MHTFQPYPIDKMEFNPFTKIWKRMGFSFLPETKPDATL